MTVAGASVMIAQGRPLLIAGDERLLRQLPRGRWLGGTIPYFMTDEGGLQSDQRLFVTALPDACVEGEVRVYAVDELERLPRDYPQHGVSFVIMPAGAGVVARLAREGANWPGFFERPLVGWVAGVALADVGRVRPLVFDGTTGEAFDDRAAVLHVPLPRSLVAKVEIVNLFTQGHGDVITFPEEGFSATTCFVNGTERRLADYLAERHADARWPLVADFAGADINVAFMSTDPVTQRVDFYGPVFVGVEYRLAPPVVDYAASFAAEFERRQVAPVFACNCVLNYAYASLEGRKTGRATGPFTFGEIAWMLLNQTAVYLTFERVMP
jgi:hypothetical protein